MAMLGNKGKSRRGEKRVVMLYVLGSILGDGVHGVLFASPKMH